MDTDDPTALTRVGAPEAPAPVPELSRLMVLLLKGVQYRDDDEALWGSLQRLQSRVREHAGVLLLDLVLDEAEGFAFLKGRPDPDEPERGPRSPRLVARRPLSYPVSLLLALLRRRLAEFDGGGSETRLVLTSDEIAELLRVFLPDGPNEAKLLDQVDRIISRVVELGFLRPLKAAGRADQEQPRFEVRRILKAFVDAQWVSDFDARLEAYRNGSATASSGPQVGEDAARE